MTPKHLKLTKALVAFGTVLSLSGFVARVHADARAHAYLGQSLITPNGHNWIDCNNSSNTSWDAITATANAYDWNGNGVCGSYDEIGSSANESGEPCINALFIQANLFSNSANRTVYYGNSPVAAWPNTAYVQATIVATQHENSSGPIACATATFTALAWGTTN